MLADALLRHGTLTGDEIFSVVIFDRDDAAILRTVPGPDGNYESRIFSTWCPQVLAGIASLKPSIDPGI